MQLIVRPLGSGGTPGQLWELRVEVMVDNASEEPLPDAEVVVRVVAEQAVHQALVDPAQGRVHFGTVPAAALGGNPGSRTAMLSFRVPSEAPGGMVALSIAAVLLFVDQNGTRWSRDSDGVLHEVSSS